MEQWINVQFYPTDLVESLPSDIEAGLAFDCFQENEWNIEIAFRDILPLELIQPMAGFAWLESDLVDRQTGERMWRRVIVLGQRREPLDRLWWEEWKNPGEGRNGKRKEPAFPDGRYRTRSTSVYGGYIKV